MHAFLEYFDEKKVSSLLEIGCGFGLGSWILSDKFTKITGLDISKNAIETANKLFPEIDYVQCDIENYFKENPNKKFDVILSCDGPQVDTKEILKYCKYFVRIGYRPTKISGALFNMNEKHRGLQLTFSTTVVSEDYKENKISRKYLKYFISPFYTKYFFDAFRKKYFPF
jgi:SAM-dependent methyltransferase